MLFMHVQNQQRLKESIYSINKLINKHPNAMATLPIFQSAIVADSKIAIVWPSSSRLRRRQSATIGDATCWIGNMWDREMSDIPLCYLLAEEVADTTIIPLCIMYGPWDDHQPYRVTLGLCLPAITRRHNHELLVSKETLLPQRPRPSLCQTTITLNTELYDQR